MLDFRAFIISRECLLRKREIQNKLNFDLASHSDQPWHLSNWGMFIVDNLQIQQLITQSSTIISSSDEPFSLEDITNNFSVSCKASLFFRSGLISGDALTLNAKFQFSMVVLKISILKSSSK